MRTRLECNAPGVTQTVGFAYFNSAIANLISAKDFHFRFGIKPQSLHGLYSKYGYYVCILVHLALVENLLFPPRPLRPQACLRIRNAKVRGQRGP